MIPFDFLRGIKHILCAGKASQHFTNISTFHSHYKFVFLEGHLAAA